MTPPTTSRPGTGLDQLDQVQLDEPHRHVLEAAHARSAGPDTWRARKHREAHNALALAQITPQNRLRVIGLDLTGNAELLLQMNVTVPCKAPHDHRLVVFTEATLFVRYPQAVMLEDLPGVSFVQIRQPGYVWHANVDHASGVMCLGLTLPRNIPLVEVMWLAYTALAAQTWMIDDRDASGVLNRDAARWWALNRDKFPLTTTALLDDRPLEVNLAVAAHLAGAGGGAP